MRWRAPLVLFLCVLGCAAVPYTRRSQLILVSPEREAQLGAQAFRATLDKGRVVREHEFVEPIETVGWRLARVAQQPGFQWQFAVLDAPKTVNAFCLPGGKVAVYTGLFPIARTTTGLAVVLGHEIAHAVARHGAERLSQGEVAQFGGALLNAVFGGSPAGNTVLAAYGLGAQVGVLLPFSRTQESEADHIGLILMAKAGYDPHAALEFWKRMEHAGGEGVPEFLSTHPNHGTREAQIDEWMGEAMQYFQTATRAADAPLPTIARAHE